MLAPGSAPPLRIAMLGTRGVPAAYGGFETAVEEIGSRLASLGHEVTVYCRRTAGQRPSTHLGMRLVHLPAVRVKVAETLSHSALSVAHLALSRTHDVAFVFNAANSPFVPALRARGIPTAVHVDGLEWKRDKWSGAGKRYYRFAERFAVRTADALIADAQGIADYYRSEFDVPTELLTYGTRILRAQPADRLAELGLAPGQFHLVVARFEPENHVDLIVDGYRRSGSRLPLVVVGSAPYAAEYTRRIDELAAGDDRIRLLGGVYDQNLLDALYAHALSYAHGHSVGGTNPSLLRAMGAATGVIAWDIGFNREVLGTHGRYFTDADSASAAFEAAEADPARFRAIGTALQDRAERTYDWDDVTSGYESLATRLARGYSIHKSHQPTPAYPVNSNELS
jgi:glycosyltransferase involved in cell wall biosynthesis